MPGMTGPEVRALHGRATRARGLLETAKFSASTWWVRTLRERPDKAGTQPLIEGTRHGVSANRSPGRTDCAGASQRPRVAARALVLASRTPLRHRSSRPCDVSRAPGVGGLQPRSAWP